MELILEDLDVKSAMEALQKQRDDSLLLIKTEHQMRLDSANKLASFEEERLNEFYNVFLVDGCFCSVKWKN